MEQSLLAKIIGLLLYVAMCLALVVSFSGKPAQSAAAGTALVAAVCPSPAGAGRHL